jgi:hypothetical protein
VSGHRQSSFGNGRTTRSVWPSTYRKQSIVSAARAYRGRKQYPLLRSPNTGHRSPHIRCTPTCQYRSCHRLSTHLADASDRFEPQFAGDHFRIECPTHDSEFDRKEMPSPRNGFLFGVFRQIDAPSSPNWSSKLISPCAALPKGHGARDLRCRAPNVGTQVSSGPKRPAAAFCTVAAKSLP